MRPPHSFDDDRLRLIVRIACEVRFAFKSKDDWSDRYVATTPDMIIGIGVDGDEEFVVVTSGEYEWTFRLEDGSEGWSTTSDHWHQPCRSFTVVAPG